MPNPLPLSKQINILMEALRSMRLPRTDPKYDEIMKWVKDITPGARPKELTRALCKAFEPYVDSDGLAFPMQAHVVLARR